MLLLIEVADSSLQFGRTVKLGVYARAGIAEYWIVDLRRKTLKAHRKPHQGVHARDERAQAGRAARPRRDARDRGGSTRGAWMSAA